MNQSEKRRGGGSGHVLRTGPSHASRHGANAMTAAATVASSGSSSMPAMPPRAAVSSINASGADEPHEGPTGGAPLADRKDKDKDRERSENTIASSSSAGAGSNARSGSASNNKSNNNIRSSSRDKQRRQDASAAATAHLLREKDERITYLEKEMAIMEREFQQELDKLSQNESETATFWQSKHSALNQQFLRTDTELRLLRNEVDVREAEREELRQGVEVLRRELRERDDEIRRLRAQVRGLKDFVSTSTRTDDQTSDEVFGDGMIKLGNGLQNWVITNFRKAKIDLSRVDEATLGELNDLVPMYDELIYTSKVHLLQSIVSRILVEMVFDAYYVGLSDEQTRRFQQMEQLLSSFCSSSDEPVNQWRSSTLALLRREAHHLHDTTDSFAEAVILRTTTLLSSLTSSSSSNPLTNTNSSDALRVLVKNSIELARLLVVQKAKLRVYMPAILPHQRVLFEPDTMEDMGGEDEDALAGREIACVVFPGVIKHGDENGGNVQYRNVIAKARVLCSPEE
ncbi:hypothetical protein PT974_10131 [Cladobotryum mycophilum]|uniref:Uncharacterized protein n=1 Tax=Cladobotryum mycophilum TaxID=491253 RepID=A0ABR0S904_9HYPO